MEVAGSSLHYVKHPATGGAPLVWLLHTPAHYSIVYPHDAFNVHGGFLCSS